MSLQFLEVKAVASGVSARKQADAQIAKTPEVSERRMAGLKLRPSTGVFFSTSP
jgi:hypothetical protein